MGKRIRGSRKPMQFTQRTVGEGRIAHSNFIPSLLYSLRGKEALVFLTPASQHIVKYHISVFHVLNAGIQQDSWPTMTLQRARNNYDHKINMTFQLLHE